MLEAKVAAVADHRVKLREKARLARKRTWYDEVATRFGDRIEPIDLSVAEKWAEVSVRFPSLRDADKAILATAMARDYGIATENVGHFRRSGVLLVNPFDPGTWDDAGDEDPLTELLRD